MTIDEGMTCHLYMIYRKYLNDKIPIQQLIKQFTQQAVMNKFNSDQ